MLGIGILLVLAPPAIAQPMYKVTDADGNVTFDEVASSCHGVLTLGDDGWWVGDVGPDSHPNWMTIRLKLANGGVVSNFMAPRSTELDADTQAVAPPVLPACVCKLKSLTSLNVSSCNSTALPEGFRELKSLQMLNISNSGIVALPEGMLNTP